MRNNWLGRRVRGWRGPRVHGLAHAGVTVSDFEAAVALNEKLRRPLEATRDYQEGIEAFFEKRAPRFRGE